MWLSLQTYLNLKTPILKINPISSNLEIKSFRIKKKFLTTSYHHLNTKASRAEFMYISKSGHRSRGNICRQPLRDECWGPPSSLHHHLTTKYLSRRSYVYIEIGTPKQKKYLPTASERWTFKSTVLFASPPHYKSLSRRIYVYTETGTPKQRKYSPTAWELNVQVHCSIQKRWAFSRKLLHSS